MRWIPTLQSEIPKNISYPYIGRFYIYSDVKIYGTGFNSRCGAVRNAKADKFICIALKSLLRLHHLHKTTIPQMQCMGYWSKLAPHFLHQLFHRQLKGAEVISLYKTPTARRFHFIMICLTIPIQLKTCTNVSKILEIVRNWFCWYLNPLLMTGSRLEAKLILVISRQSEVIHHPQPTAPKQCMRKTHRDPHLTVSRWGSITLEFQCCGM